MQLNNQGVPSAPQPYLWFKALFQAQQVKNTETPIPSLQLAYKGRFNSEKGKSKGREAMTPPQHPTHKAGESLQDKWTKLLLPIL